MGSAISPVASRLVPPPVTGLEGGLGSGRLATAVPSRGVQEIAGQRQTSQASAAVQDAANGARPGPGEAVAAAQGDVLERVGAPRPQEGTQTNLAIGQNGPSGVQPEDLASFEEFATQTRSQQNATPPQPNTLPEPAPQAYRYAAPAAGNPEQAPSGDLFAILA